MNKAINVLFIEDNPGDARLVKEEFRFANSRISIQLEWVDCLEKGRQCLDVGNIQAILLDLNLPDNQGLDTLQRVLSIAPDTPVIVMTAMADEDMATKAVQAGAQDYLIKGEADGRLLVRAIQYAIQRKQTELLLTDAREFTERIVNSAPIGIFTYGLDGQCLSVNVSAAQMVGATVEQLERQNFRELASWKRSGLLELAERAILSKRLVAEDVHVLTTFGKDAWYRAQFVTFRSGGEELLLMIFADITERKFAEAALAAGEQRFRAWIEHSSDIVTVLDASGTIQYESPAVKRLLGYEPEELLGKNGFAFVHPEDQARIIAAFTENITRPDSGVSVEYRFRHRDGSWRFLEGLGHAYVDEHDEVVELVHSRDITERKKVEDALRDSETQYRTLMEKSLEAIYLYEMETKQVVTANQAFLNLLGYSAEEARVLTLYDIVQHDRSSIDAYLEQIQVEGALAMGERRWRRKDGTEVPMEVTANKLRQGDTDFIFVVGRDVTERKRAEQALKEKEFLLSEAQRIGRIGSWSFDIQHDTMTFSDEMYRLLDIEPEDFHHDSQDFLVLVYPSDRPIAAKWMTDIKQGAQDKDLNFRIFHKNGELCYLHCTGRVEFDHAARPTRFIGTAQDITERRVAEIQINQQIKRLTALSEIDGAIISSFDQNYTLGVILSNVISQLQVDAADVLLLDSEGEALDFAAGQGFRTKLMETAHVRIGESHAGRAAKERRMIRIPDLREATNLADFNQFVITEGFVSYVCMPLLIKGRVKGVLEVYQRSILEPYQEWLDFFHPLARQTAIAIEYKSLFANLEATNRDLTQAYDATIEGWSRAMDLHDRETKGHTQRVTQFTLALARALGIEESRLVHIRRGALLHDIGKLGVPDHILFKAGELTVEERAIIEKHPDFAYEMLAPIPYLKPALNIPYFHHEKWDGTGYPLGLKGEQIPLEARIFALVDVWDALLADRPYRKPWSREQTIEYIRAQAGAHFDPRVVECFLELMKKME